MFKIINIYFLKCLLHDFQLSPYSVDDVSRRFDIIFEVLHLEYTNLAMFITVNFA